MPAGKVCNVTEGSRGIWEAILRFFAHDGAVNYFITFSVGLGG